MLLWVGILCAITGPSHCYPLSYEASKATLGARTKTGRRPRGERNRTVDSVPVQVIQAEGEDQPTSPTTMTPQTKRQSRVSKLITRMTSFKSGGARVQRPLSSYHPPTSRHANEPAEESQKLQDLQKEQTVQVEVTPNDKDTPASATLAKEDSLPPNIVVKEPTPEPPEQEGTTPREGTPPHEGSSPQATESGSSRAHVDENHVVSHSQAEEPHPQAEEPHPQAEEPHPQAEEPHPQAEEPHPQAEEPHPQAEEPHPQAEEPHPQAEEPHPQAEEPHPQAEEPHPQVERTVLKPHPLQATHTAPKEREPSAPRDEPAVHVEEGQHVENTAKETAVAATTAVERHEEEAGLTEGTTASALLSTEDTTRQVEERAASPAGEKVSEEVPATQEPLPATIAAAASNSLAEPSPKAPSKPNSETPSKPSAGVKRFLPSELPTVPTVPTLPAEVREYLGRKFAADAIQEHLAALSSEGEEPADLPLPPMYRSFSFSGDHEDDIAPSMNEMRLFLANCA